MGELAIAKAIELRRRSRVERARQMASSIDVQAQIRMANDLSNLATEAARLKNIIGTMGANVPQIARDRLEYTQQAMKTIREGESAFVGIPAGPERVVLRAPRQLTLTGGYASQGVPMQPRRTGRRAAEQPPSLLPYLTQRLD